MSVPQKIRQELDRIFRKNGTIEPSAVVTAAEPESSPLHKYFTWDNTDAARLYRLEQARNLIRRVVEVVEAPNSGKKITIRSFVSLPSMRDNKKDNDNDCGYVPIGSAIKKVEWKKELLGMLRDDARSFMNKYANVSEAAGVVTEIRKMLRHL